MGRPRAAGGAGEGPGGAEEGPGGAGEGPGGAGGGRRSRRRSRGPRGVGGGPGSQRTSGGGGGCQSGWSGRPEGGPPRRDRARVWYGPLMATASGREPGTNRFRWWWGAQKGF
eukprot:scaffold76035_cov28-Tisochrysis_lutea.AAC.6